MAPFAAEGGQPRSPASSGWRSPLPIRFCPRPTAPQTPSICFTTAVPTAGNQHLRLGPSWALMVTKAKPCFRPSPPLRRLPGPPALTATPAGCHAAARALAACGQRHSCVPPLRREQNEATGIMCGASFERGGGGAKVCVPTMARQDFVVSPRWSLWSGGGGAGP